MSTEPVPMPAASISAGAGASAPAPPRETRNSKPETDAAPAALETRNSKLETETALAPFLIDQVPAAYTREDHAVWKLLFQRRMEELESVGSRAFLNGIRAIGLMPDRVPSLATMNARLEPITGWRAVAVNGFLEPTLFFQCLAERRFPTTVIVRPMEQLEYLPEPDIFHDVFGHVPMHADPVFADFLQRFGAIAATAKSAAEVRMLTRLFWFTVEFGLIRETRNSKLETAVYGSGLISSMRIARTPSDRTASVVRLCSMTCWRRSSRSTTCNPCSSSSTRTSSCSTPSNRSATAWRATRSRRTTTRAAARCACARTRMGHPPWRTITSPPCRRACRICREAFRHPSASLATGSARSHGGNLDSPGRKSWDCGMSKSRVGFSRRKKLARHVSAGKKVNQSPSALPKAQAEALAMQRVIFVLRQARTPGRLVLSNPCEP